MTSPGFGMPTADTRHAVWGPEDEEELEQAVSDVTVEAAPSLSHPQKDVLVTLLAGGLSGALAKTAVAPLARLTILYQVQALQPTGIATKAPGLIAAIRQVIKQEGLASLWKGNLATIMHRVPYSAANFTTFEMTKKALDPYVSSDVARRFLAGAAAGLVACTAAYPLDLVRTRLSAQRDLLPRTTRLTASLGEQFGFSPDTRFPTPVGGRLPQSMKPPRHYRGIRHAFKTIWVEEGSLGMYRGLSATLLQVTPALALNFCLYDSLKAAYLRHVIEPRQTALHTQHSGSLPSNTSEVSSFLTSNWQTTESCTVDNRSDSDSWHNQSQDTSGYSRVMSQQPQHQWQQTNQQQPTAQPIQPSSAPQLDLTGSLICASAAGFGSSTLTFPLDVIRKRLQTANTSGAYEHISFWDMSRSIYRAHGWRGFYAGIVPEYCKVLPGMAIAFAVYEGIRGAYGVKNT